MSALAHARYLVQHAASLCAEHGNPLGHCKLCGDGALRTAQEKTMAMKTTTCSVCGGYRTGTIDPLPEAQPAPNGWRIALAARRAAAGLAPLATPVAQTHEQQLRNPPNGWRLALAARRGR